MSIEECRRNIAMYNVMLDCVSAIIKNLNESKDVDDKLLFKINQNYSLNNDNSIIYDKMLNLANEVKDTSSYLSNTIIPAINAAIKAEYDTIDYIYYLIALEEERQAREAAAAAEAAAAEASSDISITES